MPNVTRHEAVQGWHHERGDARTVYTCADINDRVHSVGGGGGLTDSGPVFLQAIEPMEGLRSVRVQMTGTLAHIDGMAIQAVCGT